MAVGGQHCQVAWERIVTPARGCRRLSSPPEKSATPHVSDDARAKAIAATLRS